MTTKKNLTQSILSLTLLLIILGVTLVHATSEGDYETDNNLLSNVYEATLTENGYRTNIIINPDAAGIYTTENGYKLDFAIVIQGIGGSLDESNYYLDLIPEKAFPDFPDIAMITLMASQIHVTEGYSTSISVTVTNKGYIAETFQLTILANNEIIQTFSHVTLPSRSTTTLTLEWYFPRGFYTISASASPIPYEANTADNTQINGKVTVAPTARTRNGDSPKIIL